MFDNIDDLEHYFRFLDILDNSEFDSDLSDVENYHFYGNDGFTRMKPFYATRKAFFYF